MHKCIKKLLLGLLIWAVPFVVSLFVWNPETNAPTIGMEWFSALMGFCWTMGFAAALYIYFRKMKKNTVKEGWVTGIVWYVELIALDLIVLAGLFGMALSEIYPMLLTYLNAVLITASVGYILKK